MKLLVIGREGQVARSLRQRATGVGLVALGRPDVDLEKAGSAEAAIAREKPDVVVNAAAFTAVDAAEAEPDRAFRVNGEAAGEVARAARHAGAKLVHLSTDYVFDGSSPVAHTEDAPSNPLNHYGRSKLDGETRVRAEAPEHAIVRTAWVYSPFGRNFVTTMVAAAAQRDVLRVVADQRGSPTSALDLADAILAMVAAPAGWGETYHVAGSGTASWFELAAATMDECRRLGLPSARVEPIATADWPTPARRPANSMLDSGKFERAFGFRMPQWRESLAGVVEQVARGSQ